MEVPCMEAWEATEAIIEWACMDSNRIKESSSHLTLTLHISSILDVTSSQQWLVSMQV